MKKGWLAIPLVVGLLALLFTGGAILAQGNGHPGGGGAVKGLASRVAEILGLEEETVQSAFNQAMREHQNEHVQALLDRLLEAGRITEDEANAIMQWYQARPDAALYLRGVILRGEEALQHRLDRMVRREVITPEEAQAVREWYALRPDALPARSGPGHRSHQRPFGGDNGANGARTFREAPESPRSPVTLPIIFY